DQNTATADLDRWTNPIGLPPFSVAGDVCEKFRWLAAFGGTSGADPQENRVFGQLGSAANPPSQIEFVTVGLNSIGVAPNYRAVWTPNTWVFRPKALRFTFRVYDSADRIVNEVQVNQAPWSNNPPLVPAKRYGQEFSFVVEVP
ncbi:MAG: hypothetical protein V3T70_01385, partial [Phycisphaerae bacterium]